MAEARCTHTSRDSPALIIGAPWPHTRRARSVARTTHARHTQQQRRRRSRTHARRVRASPCAARQSSSFLAAAAAPPPSAASDCCSSAPPAAPCPSCPPSSSPAALPCSCCCCSCAEVRLSNPSSASTACVNSACAAPHVARPTCGGHRCAARALTRDARNKAGRKGQRPAGPWVRGARAHGAATRKVHCVGGGRPTLAANPSPGGARVWAHLHSVVLGPLGDDAPGRRELGLLGLGVVAQVNGLGLREEGEGRAQTHTRWSTGPWWWVAKRSAGTVAHAHTEVGTRRG